MINQVILLSQKKITYKELKDKLSVDLTSSTPTPTPTPTTDGYDIDNYRLLTNFNGYRYTTKELSALFLRGNAKISTDYYYDNIKYTRQTSDTTATYDSKSPYYKLEIDELIPYSITYGSRNYFPCILAKNTYHYSTYNKTLYSGYTTSNPVNLNVTKDLSCEYESQNMIDIELTGDLTTLTSYSITKIEYGLKSRKFIFLITTDGSKSLDVKVNNLQVTDKNTNPTETYSYLKSNFKRSGNKYFWLVKNLQMKSRIISCNVNINLDILKVNMPLSTTKK